MRVPSSRCLQTLAGGCLQLEVATAQQANLPEEHAAAWLEIQALESCHDESDPRQAAHV